MDSPGVAVQLRSCNRKLAPQRVERTSHGFRRFVPVGPAVASTYVSISATCPRTCPFRNNGCYAQAANGRDTMARLDGDAKATRVTALEVSRSEAAELASLWPTGVPQDGHRGGRDLRLHVGGDVSCVKGARALALAVTLLRARGLGAAWTFTHRWREIPRGAWGPISVLASVETEGEALEAAEYGYAPALTVDHFETRALWDIGRGWRVIPCPFEAGSPITCATCRLCLDHDLVGKRRAIAFAVHGQGADRARRRLAVIGQRLGVAHV